MTDGQRLALEQLREIEVASIGFLVLDSVGEAAFDANFVEVALSVFCGDMPRAQGGLPLRQRERLLLFIPADFPFSKPSVSVAHSRFANFPHVLWKCHFCLYQSPGTEWKSGDGMYGFVDRLNDWLRRGALAQWGVAGEPIHPPVTYPGSGPLHMVVPRSDTPPVNEQSWHGTAHLKAVSENRVDIVGWSETFAADTPTNVGAAILLSQPMPFEFPDNVTDLLTELVSRGVAIRQFLITLQFAALCNQEEYPLYVIIGTPMRGIHGDAPKQHLVAWYVAPHIANLLKIAIGAYQADEMEKRVGQLAEHLVLEWAKTAKLEWCWILEGRAEAVTRRDHQSPTSWFAGRTVALWGCGALGAHVAQYLTRAGVKKLLLRDNGVVKPGLLVRQPYEDRDIGRYKVAALGVHLLRIRDDIELEIFPENILCAPLDSLDWIDGADVLIETTASETILLKLELRMRTSDRTIPTVSMAVGHLADRGMVVITGSEYSGGPFDAIRRTKLAACDRPDLVEFRDEFWPSRESSRRAIFQPEPGCSEDTFIGSAADMAALSSTLLNLAAKDLASTDEGRATAHLFTQPYAQQQKCDPLYVDFAWPNDVVSVDPDAGYEVRIASPAWRDILGWIEKSRRTVGPYVETGGLLFGERDDTARIIWVSEVIGPPPDSQATEGGFICGTEGTQEANNEKKRRSLGTVQYVGMWHSHPGSSPAFSGTDFEGMRQIIEDSEFSPSKSLLLIVGTPESTPTIGTYLFRRSDFDRLRRGPTIRVAAITAPEPRRVRYRVGLALSGGGSRAIAFHLGCLRALHDTGVLSQVEVLSCVSGGSVIGGMYAYSTGSFDEFQERTEEFLRRGLVRSILREAVSPSFLARALGTNLIAGTSSAAATIGRLGFGRTMHAPFRRWTSITSAFENALAKRVFGETLLTDPRRNDLKVIFNACDLRSGSAFRFGNDKSGCWRYGYLANNNVPVSLAVASSAAYPVILPAIDRCFDFINAQGAKSPVRVILTDGGVFENLGVSCLEPDRSAEFSQQVFNLDYIVCCDAGQGLLGDQVYPFYWSSRMKRSFETVYRKVNDGVRKRLFSHVDSRRLKGFVLSYLGQLDKTLPYIPPDLVRREQVWQYPTDFSSMSETDIELISGRGEQLTRLLVSRYCGGL